MKVGLSDGRTLELRLRESERCRRMILRAAPGGWFELVYPAGPLPPDAWNFVNSHRVWLTHLSAKLAHDSAERKTSEPPSELFLPYTGRTFRIVYIPQDVCWIGAKTVVDSTIQVRGRVGEPENCFAVLRKWLIEEAEREILPREKAAAEALGFGVERFRFGLQQRSWGTCTRKKVVTLNAALLFFPPYAADYVMIHEFCHLQEMNHSKRFWNLVLGLCPDARKIRAEINHRAISLPPWLWKKT